MMLRVTVLIALAVVCAALPYPFTERTPINDDVVTFEMSQTGSSTPELTVTPIKTTIHNRTVTGHVAIAANPRAFFHYMPPKGFKPSPFTCVRSATSQTAIYNNCLFATNGGFFNMKTGDCEGNVISKGQVLRTTTTSWANFGTTKDGKFIAGYYTATPPTDNLSELLSGIGWLIRDGKSYLETAIQKEHMSSSFVKLLAPRTAIGHDKQGRLMIAEIDGIEDLKQGIELYEFTDLLLSMGAQNVINLDGGGSSTAFYDGKVIGTPTCDDTGRICERTVTTITCVLRP